MCSKRFWKDHELYFQMVEYSEVLGTIMGTVDRM